MSTYKTSNPALANQVADNFRAAGKRVTILDESTDGHPFFVVCAS